MNIVIANNQLIQSEVHQSNANEITSLQQMLDAYATSIAFASYKNIKLIKEFEKLNNKVIENAKEIKNQLNPKLNSFFETINRGFLYTYDDAKNDLDRALKNLHTPAGLKEFKEINEDLSTEITGIQERLTELIRISETCRDLSDENARETGGLILTLSDRLKDKEAEIKGLEKKIKECDEELINCRTSLSSKESQFKKALITLIVGSIASILAAIFTGGMALPFVLISLSGLGGTIAFAVQIKQLKARIKELEDTKPKLLQQLYFINDEVLEIKFLINEMQKINTDSKNISLKLYNALENFNALKTLIDEIQQHKGNVISINDQTSARRIKLYTNKLKTTVTDFKTALGIRNEKMSSKDSFQIEISKDLNRKFSYFPANSQGLITIPSNLAWSIANT